MTSSLAAPAAKVAFRVRVRSMTLYRSTRASRSPVAMGAVILAVILAAALVFFRTERA